MPPMMVPSSILANVSSRAINPYLVLRRWHGWAEELFAGDLAVARCVEANFSALESLPGHWPNVTGDIHGEDHGELVAVHKRAFGFE